MNYFRLLASLAALALTPAVAVQPLSAPAPFRDSFLGTAPWLDPDAPPSPSPEAASKAVVSVPAIDTSDRSAVVAAYNAYYNITMPAVGFTGSTATCTPGTISLAFQEWTISRINFLRAMAGVPGNTTLDASKNAQEQAAALIMAANSTLTHFPPNTYACWSQAGYDGAGSSNLALGTGLTDSIPLYMSDPGGGNQVVGHRRWILHSRKNSFGLGQANGSSDNASALYTFQFGSTISVPNGIPWPPRGHVPLALFPDAFSEGPRWSFGMPGANFGSATVTMTLNGAPLAATVVSRTDNGYGDNTIVWELPVGHTVAKGSTYGVTISGVASAGSTNYSYQVLPFDPADVPTTRTVTVSKSGTGSGTVASVPAGINCGSTCSASFNPGTSVVLTASASAGSTFTGWSGACSGTATCTVTMDATKNVTATFIAAFDPNVRSVVSGYYLTILGRAADQAGLDFWAAEATRVTGLGADVREVFFAMSMAFFSSTEYVGKNTSDMQFITDLYRTFFNRTPDASGLAYWQGELTASGSRSALLNSFLFSAEFSNQMTAQFGSASVRPEITMAIDLFRGVFGRLPDSAGFNYWLGRLRIAQCQGAAAVATEVNNIAGQFFNSSEYLARSRSNRDFMGDVYNAYLRRGPGGDTGGFSYWVGQVPALGRDGVRAQFVPSAEFQGRVAAVVNAGCLQ